jgi:glutamyl-tRNA reductase
MFSKSPIIFCKGINHHLTPIELREKFNFDSDQLIDLQMQLQQEFGFLEVLCLATCNRFEIYAVVGEDYDLEGNIFDFIIKKYNFVDICESKFAFLKKASYFYKEVEAVRHLFRVVSSLDSLCVGETQITNQFKKALESGFQQKTISTYLNKLGQKALFVNKKIRTDAYLRIRPQSISHLAVDMAKQIFNDMSTKKFLFIGAGTMIKLACQHAVKLKPQDIYVVNRDPARAKKLCSFSTNISSYHLSDLETLLIKSDIVIASTASPSCMIGFDLMKKVQKLRKYKPIYLVDIALPRDIDSRCSALEEVYLFDLDDIKNIFTPKGETIQTSQVELENVIKKHSQEFIRWKDAHQSKSNNLGYINSYLEALFSQEFKKTHSKNMFSCEQTQALKKMFLSVRRKIVADIAHKKTAQETEASFFVQNSLSGLDNATYMDKIN